MKILSVDTSSNAACIGLFQVNNNQITKVYFDFHWDKKRSHSEVITSLFLQGLKESKLTAEDINLICLGVGPGSFTGIRVALNFAKALAYSYSIDIYSVNSLLPLTYQYKNTADRIIVLNNAFRNMVYGTCVELNPFVTRVNPFSCQAKNINKFIDADFLNLNPLIIGDAFDLYKDHFPKDFIDKCRIESSQKKKISENLVNCYLQDKSPELLNWRQVLPLYIRGSEAEEKLNKKINT